MTIVATNPANETARLLIGELDSHLAEQYPGSPINGIDVDAFTQAGGYFVLALEGDTALGCGAFRPIDTASAEIKRMFVRPVARRRGVARGILQHLEAEIRRRGFRTIVLETGCQQLEAIALYEAAGYSPIPTFGRYVGSPISSCFAKNL
jgi:GNAT superfamily N-acetyltransferase